MPLRVDILTLFPDMFGSMLGTSIPKRAAEKGLVSYHLTDLRHFATNAHKSVDDKPFGGGPGMVMMCQVVFDAVEAIEALDPRPPKRILLSPQGRRFDQNLAEELAAEQRLLLIAGHYEGFDERIVDGLRPTEVSIGDYILSGGELAAMVIVDAVVRLLPGALALPTARRMRHLQALRVGCWSTLNILGRESFAAWACPRCCWAAIIEPSPLGSCSNASFGPSGVAPTSGISICSEVLHRQTLARHLDPDLKTLYFEARLP